ncbi:MAG: hypothetical protein KC464_23290, partial [Myxococcales bacterium]|nr:hypothetical protein [Myxococcales bacterium]
MKTLTEFSSIVIRRAAEARAARAAEGLEAEALVAAVAGDLGVNEERVARLLEAIEVVGDGLDRVRLVRVFQGEQAPLGAVTKGEFHYVIDRVATGGGKRRDDRRGGGDRGGDRGGGGGGRGPGGPGR